jgi:DNA repair exonuclease SbcCD ATPase subunit
VAEVAEVETVDEVAEVVETEVVVEPAELEVVTESAETIVAEQEVVERGEIQSVLQAQELSDEVREIYWTFTDLAMQHIYGAMYSGEPSAAADAAARVSNLASECSMLISALASRCETAEMSAMCPDCGESSCEMVTEGCGNKKMSAPTVSIQETLLKRANAGKEVIEQLQRTIVVKETVVDETAIQEKEAELVELRNSIEKLNTEKEELARKVKELGELPAEMPQIERDAKEVNVRRQAIDNAFAKGDKVNAIKYVLGLQ